MRNLATSIKRWMSSYAPAHFPRRGDKVVVGMSGGVDSSVTAALLSEKDYDLSAVFMRNWDTRDEAGSDRHGCEWEKDWEDVQKVCKQLDIPCQMIDLSKEYWNNVFLPSLHLWESGSTPNPDVWCNKEIKFGSLLERLPSSSTWFATGHYARKTWTEVPEGPFRPQLLRGVDRHKDQSYYLSSISEASLRRALFPLGFMDKNEVRQLAKEYQLPNAERSESMGICFVGEKPKFNHFLSSYFHPSPGPIVDKTTGRIVAEHGGLWNYTIGEGARIPGVPVRLFVSGKDPATNTIFVVPGTDNPILNCKSLHIPEFAWIWKDSPPPGLDSDHGFHARVKYRYRMKDEACIVHRLPNGTIRIDFDEHGNSISPGQFAAVYDGPWCLGCGMIERTS